MIAAGVIGAQVGTITAIMEECQTPMSGSLPPVIVAESKRPTKEDIGKHFLLRVYSSVIHQGCVMEFSPSGKYVRLGCGHINCTVSGWYEPCDVMLLEEAPNPESE